MPPKGPVPEFTAAVVSIVDKCVAGAKGCVDALMSLILTKHDTMTWTPGEKAALMLARSAAAILVLGVVTCAAYAKAQGHEINV